MSSLWLLVVSIQLILCRSVDYYMVNGHGGNSRDISAVDAPGAGRPDDGRYQWKHESSVHFFNKVCTSIFDKFGWEMQKLLEDGNIAELDEHVKEGTIVKKDDWVRKHFVSYGKGLYDEISTSAIYKVTKDADGKCETSVFATIPRIDEVLTLDEIGKATDEAGAGPIYWNACRAYRTIERETVMPWTKVAGTGVSAADLKTKRAAMMTEFPTKLSEKKAKTKACATETSHAIEQRITEYKADADFFEDCTAEAIEKDRKGLDDGMEKIKAKLLALQAELADTPTIYNRIWLFEEEENRQEQIESIRRSATEELRTRPAWSHTGIEYFGEHCRHFAPEETSEEKRAREAREERFKGMFAFSAAENVHNLQKKPRANDLDQIIEYQEMRDILQNLRHARHKHHKQFKHHKIV